MPTEPPIELLFVEDDDDDFLLARKALEDGRRRVTPQRVADGVTAMDYLRRRPPYENAARPDLVLLDLNMPRKDGREVLREIKGDPDLRRIPVVVFTTSDAERDIEESYAHQANSFVTKPVDLAEFRACLDALQQYWFGVVKLPSR